MSLSASRLPTFYIPHGGGPCFFMDPPPEMPTLWDAMAAYLRSLLQLAGMRPKALLVISAPTTRDAGGAPLKSNSMTLAAVAPNTHSDD